MTDASQQIAADAKKAADIRAQQERMRNEQRKRDLEAESRRKASENSKNK